MLLHKKPAQNKLEFSLINTLYLEMDGAGDDSFNNYTTPRMARNIHIYRNLGSQQGNQKLEPILKLFLIFLELRYSGDIIISDKDYQRPIILDFGKNVEVFQADIFEGSINKQLSNQLLDIPAPGKVQLNPIPLKSGESFKLRVQLTRKVDDMNIEGEISGVDIPSSLSLRDIPLPLSHYPRLLSRSLSRREIVIAGIAGLAGLTGWIVAGATLKQKPQLIIRNLIQNDSSKLSYTYDKHTDGIYSVAWSPDGRYIASTGRDKTVQVWDASGRTTQPVVKNYLGGTGEGVAWSHDNQYIATVDDDNNQLVIWNAKTGAHVYSSQQQPAQLRCVAWSPSGEYLAYAGREGHVYVLDVTHLPDSNSVKLINTYTGHQGTVNSIAWSPFSEFIVSAGVDLKVQVWEAISGTSIHTYKKHSIQIASVGWSFDGKYIASGDYNGEVHIWNAPSMDQNIINTIIKYSFYEIQKKPCAHALSWSSDSQYLAVGYYNGSVIVLGINGSAFHINENRMNAVSTVAWSAQDNLIASASSDEGATTVQIWHVFNK